MFSSENRRFSLIAIGIVSIVVMVVLAMVVLFGIDLVEGAKSISQSTLVAVGAITAFAGIAVNQLFIILRYEQGHKEGQEERAQIAQQVQETKQTVIETKDKAEVNRAEIEALRDKTIIVNREELKLLLSETAKQICDEYIKSKG